MARHSQRLYDASATQRDCSPHGEKLTRQLDTTITALGHRAIDDINAEDVLSVVNPIAEPGQVETAHEIRTRFSQVFRSPTARGLIFYDTAVLTIGAMVKRQRGEFSGITDPKEIGELMRPLYNY